MLDASSEKKRIPGFKTFKDKTQSMLEELHEATQNTHRFTQFISDSAEHRKLKRSRDQAHAAEIYCLNYFVWPQTFIHNNTKVPVTL